MAVQPPDKSDIIELGEAIIRAMHSWADKKDSGEVDARLPVSALLYAAERTISVISREKRADYARHFGEELQKRFGPN